MSYLIDSDCSCPQGDWDDERIIRWAIPLRYPVMEYPLQCSAIYDTVTIDARVRPPKVTRSCLKDRYPNLVVKEVE